MTKSNNYCVILAGGKGKRLWPSSRERYPKQFIDFFGCGSTQLQQTYERFAHIVPRENIFIITNAIYEDIVREQLPEIADINLMMEPVHRNTAPAAAWATHRIYHINAEANVVITPSDQIIQDERLFALNMNKGFEFVAAHDCILAMGVKPSRPEPGYGYIQLGESINDNVYSVQSFTEKPEREFAKMFMESGEFYWNTGLYLSNARHAMQAFGNVLPVVLRDFDKENPVFSIESENIFIKDNFPSYPNTSIDSCFLEKSDNVAVMKCNFGWADLGTWHSVYEVMSKGEGDNVIIDCDAMIDNARNNVIRLPKGKLAVVNGLDGYIVAEKDNVLFICKKEDSSALVRKFVNDIQIKKGDEYV